MQIQNFKKIQNRVQHIFVQIAKDTFTNWNMVRKPQRPGYVNHKVEDGGAIPLVRRYSGS